MLNKAKRKLNLIIGYDICAYYTFQEYMGHEINFLTRQRIQSLFIAFSFGINNILNFLHYLYSAYNTSSPFLIQRDFVLKFLDSSYIIYLKNFFIAIASNCFNKLQFSPYNVVKSNLLSGNRWNNGKFGVADLSGTYDLSNTSRMLQ